MKIRTRLTLLYTAVLMLLLVLMFLAVYWLFARTLYDDEGRRIQDYVERVADEVEWEDGHVEVDLEDDDIEEIVRIGLISVYSPEGVLLASNHETAWLEDVPRRDGQVQQIEQGLHWQVYDRQVREDGRTFAWLRLALPLEEVAQTMANLRNVFLLGAPFCLLLSVLSGLWITRRALAPINHMTRTAREIGQGGDLSKRLDFPAAGDEIGELAATFDAMLDSLEGAFQREKQFSSDASHELRTPLAVIMAQGEAALNDPDATEDSQRAALAVMHAKAKDMQRMLSQLLMLARGDAQAQGLEMQPLNPAELIEDIMAEMQPAAEEKQIHLALEMDDSLWLQGDLMLFTRLVMNLVDNGIKYGRRGGCVQVSLARANPAQGGPGGQEILLTVADDGQGISSEDLAHVFERFYRSDKARSGGGFGLGLSLVKWIVELHGGSIDVASIEGKGSRFVLTFPAIPAP